MEKHEPQEVTSRVIGYRQLSEAEQALINEGKALAEVVGAYIQRVKDASMLGNEIDLRWLNIGVTDLQKGFMAVIRAIARPTTF